MESYNQERWRQKDIKRRSRSLDNQDRDSINEWLIIPYEWQIPIIIYERHVKTRSHLKIRATLDHILAEEYKWDSIYSDVKNFWFKCQIWQVISGKLRKREIVHYIRSLKPLERCQIDLKQLARVLCTKPYKYLFTMVDHFSKYEWAKCIIDKKSAAVIKALQSCLTSHHNPQMIQSDYGREFSGREFKQFLLKQNIDHKFDPPCRPKCQGAVESLNKIIQKFLEMVKYHKKDKYDLEDCVNDFLIYYNNRKHSTTGIAPYVIMRNVNDQELIQKVFAKPRDEK